MPKTKPTHVKVQIHPSESVPNTVGVFVFNTGEGMVDDGLPSDFSESAVELAVGEFFIATELDIALNQFRRAAVQSGVENVAFQSIESGAEMTEGIAP